MNLPIRASQVQKKPANIWSNSAGLMARFAHIAALSTPPFLLASRIVLASISATIAVSSSP